MYEGIIDYNGQRSATLNNLYIYYQTFQHLKNSLSENSFQRWLQRMVELSPDGSGQSVG